MALLARRVASSETRSNRAFIWSWILVGVHLVMAIDDLIIFAGRLQTDGFFHKVGYPGVTVPQVTLGPRESILVVLCCLAYLLLVIHVVQLAF